MSRFYVIIEGDIEKRVWCDNSDCLYYSTRNGVHHSDKVLTVGRMHFCSHACWDQASKKGEAPSASAVARAEQLLKDGKTVKETHNELLNARVQMPTAAIMAARLKYLPDTGWPL